MTGLARLTRPGPQPARTIPTAAVFGDGGLDFVLVEQEHTATGAEYRRKAVAVGRVTGSVAEIAPATWFLASASSSRVGTSWPACLAPQVLRPGPEAAKAIGLTVEPAGAAASSRRSIELEGEIDLPPDRRAGASAPARRHAGEVARRAGAGGAGRHVVAEVASLELLSLQLDLLRAHREGAMARRRRSPRLRAAGAGPRRAADCSSWTARLRPTGSSAISLDRRLRLLGLSPEQQAAVLGGRAGRDAAGAGTDRRRGGRLRPGRSARP